MYLRGRPGYYLKLMEVAEIADEKECEILIFY